MAAHIPPVSAMLRESGEAGAAVARLFSDTRETMARVVADLVAAPPPFAMTCARGSSDHAATYAKYLFETRLGLVTASLPPSVASVYRARLARAGALFLTVSQSGGSPDLLAAVESANADGALTLALVNTPGSPVERASRWTLPLSAGRERSVAATKSYLASLAAIAWLTAELGAARGGDAAGATTDRAALAALPQQLHAAAAMDWSPLVDALTTARGLFVLARGPGLAAAQEVALKFKETCGLHAEAFSVAEVKHGPMALIATGLPVLVLGQADASANALAGVAAEIAQFGARVFAAGVTVDGATMLPTVITPAWLSPITAVASAYPAIAALSAARHHDADAPPFLKKVTETL